MAATSSRVMRGLAGLYVGMYFTFFILCLRRLPLRLPEKTKIRNAFPLLDLHRVALGRCQQSARGRRLGDFGNGDSLTSQNCFQHLDTLLQDADSLEGRASRSRIRLAKICSRIVGGGIVSDITLSSIENEKGTATVQREVGGWLKAAFIRWPCRGRKCRNSRTPSPQGAPLFPPSLPFNQPGPSIFISPFISCVPFSPALFVVAFPAGDDA